MEMWSPYASNYNNPILYQDPLGNAPEECCGDFLKTVFTASVASITVLTDNILGTNFTGDVANSGNISNAQRNNWNTAVTSANRASQVVGIGATIVGGGIVGGSIAITEGTAGLSLEVTGPTLALGLGVTALGSQLTANSTINLAKENGLIRDKNAPPGTYDNKPGIPKEKNRVVDQKPGEKTLNQSDGINKKKEVLNKNKVEGQKKQTTIYSTKKDKNNVKKQLRETRTQKDALENY